MMSRFLSEDGGGGGGNNNDDDDDEHYAAGREVVMAMVSLSNKWICIRRRIIQSEPPLLPPDSKHNRDVVASNCGNQTPLSFAPT